MEGLKNMGQLTPEQRALPGISLNEEGFSKMLALGYIEEGGKKEQISKKQFNELIQGNIVVGKYFRIILQDIGYDRIYNAMNKIKTTWFR